MSDVTYASEAHRVFRTTKYFGSLDGLRCAAVLAVIWYHTTDHAFADIPLLSNGHYGVTLFFAISGFLITTLLLREREKNGEISLRKFYMRRSLRIFPLYYTVLAVYTAVVLLVEGDSDAGREFMHNLPAFATYTSNWLIELDGQRVIFYFAWSLAAEEQFYLVWPWIQRQKSFWGPVAVASVTVVVGYLAYHGHLGLADGLVREIISSVPPAICVGAIIAHLLHHERTFPITYRVFGHRLSAPFFLALLLGYVAIPSNNLSVVHLLCALLVAACVCREDHLFRAPLGLAPVRYLGTISYGMYLLHMLAKNGYDKIAGRIGIDRISEAVSLPPTIPRFVGTTLIVVVVASLSYRYYESFFLKLKSRYAT